MYGWGHIFFFKTISKYISLNITIGMAVTLFIGGILNFLNLAYQNTLNIIFFIGVILFIIKVYKIQLNIKSLNFIKDLNKNYFFFLLPILLLFLNIISSINPEAYNYHDDFQTYFIHPIKMLETGSVFGSTLGSVGTITFGGQAFFQSFYINWLGLKAINIFDSVFCLSICVFLIIE